jgi:hypothetical protein
LGLVRVVHVTIHVQCPHPLAVRALKGEGREGVER